MFFITSTLNKQDLAASQIYNSYNFEIVTSRNISRYLQQMLCDIINLISIDEN